MSRLKPRPMPNLFDLIDQKSNRMEKDGQSEEIIPVEVPVLAVDQEIEVLADAAFCRQCGEWLSSDYISLGISFRCPKCDYTLFSINRIGARAKWEKNK